MADKRFQLEFVLQGDPARTEDQENHDVAKLLLRVVSRIMLGDSYHTFRNITDDNGNIVGTFSLKEIR